MSNVPTPFHLQVELGDLQGKLKPIWQRDKKQLSIKTVESVRVLEESPPPEKEVKRKGGWKKRGNEAKDKAGEVKKSLSERYTFIRNIMNIFASILDALVIILPKSMEGPFRTLSSDIRRTQANASSAMSKPRQIEASGRSLRSSAGRLQRETGLDKKTAKGRETSEERGEEEIPAVIKRTVTTSYQVTETHIFEPAEKTFFCLKLRPRNPFKGLKGDFTVLSQQIEMEEYPSYDHLEPVRIPGAFTIKELGLGYFLLFFTVCLGVLVFNSWWTLATIQWLTQF
jgi:hypothetical protein